jgi:hypothetical protein
MPWGFFSLGSVQEVRDRLYKEAVADYVEMFKASAAAAPAAPLQALRFGGVLRFSFR